MVTPMNFCATQTNSTRVFDVIGGIVSPGHVGEDVNERTLVLDDEDLAGVECLRILRVVCEVRAVASGPPRPLTAVIRRVVARAVLAELLGGVPHDEGVVCDGP